MLAEAGPRPVELDCETEIFTDLVDAALDLLKVDAAAQAVFEMDLAHNLQLHLNARSKTDSKVLYGWKDARSVQHLPQPKK